MKGFPNRGSQDLLELVDMGDHGIEIGDMFKQFQRIDAGNTLVLDVRTAEDFVGEQGHISSAVNIALEDLPQRLDELSGHIDKPVAIVCRTDRRSAKAALILAQQGFHDVHVVDGGMTSWNKAGLPVEGKQA